MTWIDEQDPGKVHTALTRAREAGFTTYVGGRSTMDYASGDERFALWLMLADRKCIRATGVSIFDVADWHWFDAYADGIAPSEAVQEALAEDGLVL